MFCIDGGKPFVEKLKWMAEDAMAIIAWGACASWGCVQAAKPNPTQATPIDKVIKKHPQIKIVATTLREVHSTNRHSWGAVAWIDGKTYAAPTLELDVLDRVGGGDGYAAGFFYGLLTGVEPEEAVKLGWAHGALLTTFPGDTTMATLEQVRALAKGGSARIQR